MQRPTSGPAGVLPRSVGMLPRSVGVGAGGAAGGAPAHHGADGRFRNPWPSFVDRGAVDFVLRVAPELRKLDTWALPSSPPPWGALAAPAEALQALHIGHATFLFQACGWNVLTDPVFSARASPFQWAGPARYTPPACALGDLPPVHVVLLSHNHYDHIDADSIAALLRKEAADAAAARAGGGRYAGALFVCPLRVGALLQSLGVPPDRIVELDWWEAFTPALTASGALDPVAARGARHALAAAPPPDTAAPRIVCTPAQHQSARTPFDRNQTLWCSYTVVVPQAEAAAGGAGGDLRFFFSGDTGYRAVPRGAALYSRAETAGPVCPAFKAVGDALGPLDLAVLPIGAYSPRWFMSSFHASPEDAVHMHRDLRARRSVGMHWGVFPLTDEPIEEPPLRLAVARRLAGIADDAFVAARPGAVVGATAAVAAGDVAAVDAAAVDAAVAAARAVMAAEAAAVDDAGAKRPAPTPAPA